MGVPERSIAGVTGVGRTLPFRCAHNAVRLARDLRAVLGEPAYARAAAEIAATSRGLDGALVAAQRIIAAMN